MNLALRPYVTAGVVLTSVGIAAIPSVTTTPPNVPDVAVPVRLTASAPGDLEGGDGPIRGSGVGVTTDRPLAGVAAKVGEQVTSSLSKVSDGFKKSAENNKPAPQEKAGAAEASD